MSLNFSALTYHTPSGLSFEKGRGLLYFYRLATGVYHYHGEESNDDVWQAAGLSAYAARFTLQEVHTAANALGYTLKGNPWVRKSADYEEFLQTQFEFLRGARHQAQGQQAAAEFRLQVDQLLTPLANAELRGMPLRDLTNPVRCRALSKRREGVFVWPNWEREDTVHLVVSVPPAVTDDVKTQVYDWLDKHHLRIALNSTFN